MKSLLFALMLLFLVACQSAHLGCQEGEIVDGQCVLSSDTNQDLFGQDLTNSVKYEEVEGEVLGFLAEPLAPGEYPGVIMIHEWWGLNDNIKEMAKILASEGYVVLAIDLYGGEVASTSDEARALSGSVRSNPDDALEHMQRGVEFLREKGAERVGSLGWCFGGGQSLQLSLNENIDATVIYYGSLVDNSTQLQNLESVLGIFGSEDTSIPVTSVEAFDSSLDTLDVENQIYIYEGVGHAFANPSGNNYAPNQTLDAWNKTIVFLDEKLK